ncbi:hypothetical protein D5F01_LYC22759 [Larimichthys crocea]|uniref:Uncharacterized protein n=1 Tax=Larimichthys crocea TaxID=215358 RepID=A0A6G0HJA3_LARCR|nr:hypothetical protein D5F01_LYC22759 [Larimichthys crocea]
MEEKFSFFPGKISVVFRKGPRGYLCQDPSDAAKLLKDNSSLQDKSAPLKEDTVKQNALTVIRQRGGDVSDRTEVLGEYILQFGNFEEIISLLRFQSEKPTSQAASEDDQLVGFGTRAESTWQEMWENRADGYAAFIMRAKCFSGSQMHKLQQYLMKKESASLPSPPVLASSAHDEPMMMEDDEELEKAMQSISPAKELQSLVPPRPTVKKSVPLPPELQFLAKELAIPQQTEGTVSAPVGSYACGATPAERPAPETH